MAPREIRLEPKGRPALRPAAAKHLAEQTRKEERKKAKEQQDASKKSAKKKARDEKKAAKKEARAVAPVLKKLSSIRPGAAAKTVEELQERVARAKEKLAGGQSGETKPWDKLAAFVDKVRDFAGAGGAPGKGGPPPAFDEGARDGNEAATEAEEETQPTEGGVYELLLEEKNRSAWKQVEKGRCLYVGQLAEGAPLVAPGQAKWAFSKPWPLQLAGMREQATDGEVHADELADGLLLERIPRRAKLRVLDPETEEPLSGEHKFDSATELKWLPGLKVVMLEAALESGRKRWRAIVELPDSDAAFGPSFVFLLAAD